MGILGRLGAVDQQAAHRHEGKGVLRVLEKRQVQAGLADQAVGVLAQLP
jgi:hypothetical protein